MENEVVQTAPTWSERLSGVLDTVIGWATNTGIKIIIALIVMLITFKIINVIGRKIEKAGTTGKLDKTLSKVFAYIFKLGLKIVIGICLVGYVGIDTSGLAALVTSLGVCIGLAVNGALSNLAGGVLIIITRPFKVDDYIEAQGVSGTVDEIRITATRIITPDNKVIYLPNGALSSGTIINYSEKDTRRVEHTFSIAYENDAVPQEAMNEIFTPEEMGRISKMKLARMQLSSSEEDVLSESIVNLKRAVLKKQASSTNTFEGLDAVLKRKRNN